MPLPPPGTRQTQVAHAIVCHFRHLVSYGQGGMLSTGRLGPIPRRRGRRILPPLTGDGYGEERSTCLERERRRKTAPARQLRTTRSCACRRTPSRTTRTRSTTTAFLLLAEAHERASKC